MALYMKEIYHQELNVESENLVRYKVIYFKWERVVPTPSDRKSRLLEKNLDKRPLKIAIFLNCTFSEESHRHNIWRNSKFSEN